MNALGMRRTWPTMACAGILMCLGCGGSEDQEVKATEWVTSDDGVLSLRLLAEHPVPPGAPLVLLADLRNDGEEPLTILRPFGDEYASLRRLRIAHGGGALSYSGAVLDYCLGPDSFVVISPGEVIRDRLEVTAGSFEALAESGNYTITYTYVTAECILSSVSFALKDGARKWRIESQPVTVRKR